MYIASIGSRFRARSGRAPPYDHRAIGRNIQGDTAVKEPSSEIAEGIGAIVHEIRTQSPTSKILILAIFPRLAGPDPVRERLADASQRASQYADGENVFYLDIGNAFLEADGTLSEGIMPDFLHPTTNGYQIWADAIEPTLRRLLDE